MPVVIPYTFVGGPGRKAKASEVNADFQAIASKFTEQPGGIADADVYTFADLNANKLSSTAGKRITAAKFEPGAVDAAALKSDPSLGSGAAAVGSSAHIKDGVVTKNKLKIRFEEQVFSTTLVSVGLTAQLSTTFPTTDFCIGAYIKYPSQFQPSATSPALTPDQARRWLKTSFDTYSSGTVGFDVAKYQVFNSHASTGIELGTGARVVFVFIQN